MGIFEDKKYDEMDWLSQAIEPIICSLNDELMALPDEVILTYEDMSSILGEHWSLQIDEINVIKYALSRKDPLRRIAGSDISIVKAYTINSNCVIDFEEKQIVAGSVRVIKAKNHFEEKELLAMMGRSGLSILRNLDNKEVTIERANEILELLALDKARSSKSLNSKIEAIICEYENIMSENRWNIRNVDLSNRIAEWIYEFLKTGNLAGLTNFCKLKVMTHNGAPIYSITEEDL